MLATLQKHIDREERTARARIGQKMRSNGKDKMHSHAPITTTKRLSATLHFRCVIESRTHMQGGPFHGL